MADYIKILQKSVELKVSLSDYFILKLYQKDIDIYKNTEKDIQKGLKDKCTRLSSELEKVKAELKKAKEIKTPSPTPPKHFHWELIRRSREHKAWTSYKSLKADCGALLSDDVPKVGKTALSKNGNKKIHRVGENTYYLYKLIA